MHLELYFLFKKGCFWSHSQVARDIYTRKCRFLKTLEIILSLLSFRHDNCHLLVLITNLQYYLINLNPQVPFTASTSIQEYDSYYQFLFLSRVCFGCCCAAGDGKGLARLARKFLPVQLWFQNVIFATT